MRALAYILPSGRGGRGGPMVTLGVTLLEDRIHCNSFTAVLYIVLFIMERIYEVSKEMSSLSPYAKSLMAKK
jgi:hypothetical protein